MRYSRYRQYIEVAIAVGVAAFYLTLLVAGCVILARYS